jgi:hypothetical protein
MTSLQYKINNAIHELQIWFKLNNLVGNTEKMMAVSFHTLQNKRPVSTYIICEGRDIQCKMETKFSGIYINQNMKWNSHIKYLSSKLNTSYYMINSVNCITNPHILRSMYLTYCHAHLRYALTLCGGDHESKRICKLQIKVIRIISSADQNVSCRNLFRDLNILPVPCLYIIEVICYIKLNIDKMKLNEEIHDLCTGHKSDLHVQFCKTTLLRNSVANSGYQIIK